ncbi:MAG: gephyrin-like molybdotransferase Glp [Pseudomonadota bacterium]|nr:gephyrin-like molybdotransferase Glp [Pseudomonadota bacterium]
MSKTYKNACINEFDRSALSFEQALSKIVSTVHCSKKLEIVSLKDSVGRIVAENIISKINIPSFKNSAMDGYAINTKTLSNKKNIKLKEVGSSFAGKPYLKDLKSNETVKVMTGAVLPKNADAVIMKEMTNVSSGFISLPKNFTAGQNVRYVGEDVKKNSVIISRGKTLNYVDLGLIASVGIQKVKVIKKPTISFFSTGDELVSVGKKLKIGQIYDSNRYLLHGLLSELPVKIKDLGVVRDDKKQLEKKFLSSGRNSNFIITTGGVSVGDADFVREVLEKVGKINFWKISIKPGRPLAFGKIKNSYFFGLPGNPVSTVVTFQLFVIPAIEKMLNKIVKNSLYINAKVKCNISKKKGRLEFQRAKLIKSKGTYFVQTTGLQGSNILSSLASANCYIRLPSNISKINKGDIVEVLPFSNKF